MGGTRELQVNKIHIRSANSIVTKRRDALEWTHQEHKPKFTPRALILDAKRQHAMDLAA
jgi:hypothetical protein